MRATKFSLIAVSISLFALAAGQVANADMLTLTATETTGLTGSATGSGIFAANIGTILLPATVGDFSVIASATLTDDDPSFINTTTITVNNNGNSAETIDFSTSATGVMSPLGNDSLYTSLGATFLPSGGTATDTGYLNSSQTGPITLTGPIPPNNGSITTFSSPTLVLGVTSGFTLSDLLAVTVPANGTVNLNVTTVAASTPEPSRIVGLLGLALMGGMGLCFSSARKRKPAIC